MTVSESALEAAGAPRGGVPQGIAAGAGARPGAPPLPLVAGRAGPRWRTLRRLSRHRSGMLGLAGLLLIALVALVGPRFLPYDPTAVDMLQKLQPPSAAHPLGTDYLGRDLLSRTVDGAHRSLGTAVVVVGCVLLVSVGLGALAGFAGGAVDASMMRVVDVLLGLPWLVLALVLVGTLGPSLGTLMLALDLGPVAVVHPHGADAGAAGAGAALRPRGRVHGAGPVALVWRHVLPAVLGQLVVLATLDLGSVVLAVAGLSFLGLGVQPPPAGVGGDAERRAHHLRPAAPGDDRAGVLHLLTVLWANLLGDALRDILDPTWGGDRG